MCVHAKVLKNISVWGLKALKSAKPPPRAVKTRNGSEVSRLGRAWCSPWRYPSLYPLPIKTYEKRGESPRIWESKVIILVFYLGFVKLEWDWVAGWRRDLELSCSRDNYRWSLYCNIIFCLCDKWKALHVDTKSCLCCCVYLHAKVSIQFILFDFSWYDLTMLGLLGKGFSLVGYQEHGSKGGAHLNIQPLEVGHLVWGRCMSPFVNVNVMKSCW